MMLGPAIAPFQPTDLPPPARALPFFGWALRGAWAGVLWATFWSAIAGSLEAVSAVILGHVIDAATGTPTQVFEQHWQLFAIFAAFYLIVRPIVFGINTTALSLIIEPNLFPLILSRLHRWTLGHSVTFFDNDFAGRIAQKQMQTARAATDVVSGTIETAAFALASVVGSVALMVAIDGAVSLVLLAWVLAYGLFIRY